MEILFITDDNSLKIPSDDRYKLVTTPPDQIEVEKIEGYDMVVVDARNPEAQQIVKSIRQSQSDAIALKPVFLFSTEEIKDMKLQCLSDGKTDSGEPLRIVSHANEISRLVSTLKEFKPENFEISAMLRILRFLYTRSIQLKPMILPTYRYGYIYPFAASQFSDDEDFRIYEILVRLEQEGLLMGNFYDRIHLCNRCRSAFMNFREICPSCKSANLSVENVIHHFSCGYTSEESKFTHGEQLICPKCNKILKHIGMDYEKPSTIFICHSCNETFQEPLVECFCFYCTNRTPVDETVSWDIKTYEITPAGVNCAIHGIMFSFAEFLSSQLDLVEYNDFKKMVDLEIERNKRYKRESSVAVFQVSNLQQIFFEIGEKKNELALEMAKIIKDALRKTDLISVLNESTFLLLFLETPAKNAQIALSRIKNNIEKLLIPNLSTSGKKFIPQITTNVLPVEEFSLNKIFP
ncbi:MAG TPA: diguanylate cyclase [bacterium]|nr:diguanylate cyclase [bacterium]HOL35540.1 diguanylate cyclase [bacterium]HPP07967.1 diguanylate cyclase [bacterium]